MTAWLADDAARHEHMMLSHGKSWNSSEREHKHPMAVINLNYEYRH